MGKRNRRIITYPSLYFVTTTTKDWTPHFRNRESRDELENLLFSFFPSHADALVSYVIMLDHLHLLVGCRSGGVQLSKFMQAFKSISARRMFPGLGHIWTRRFDDLLIRNDAQFVSRIDYIHHNPVRKGFVERAEEWEWSSASFWSHDDPHPVLTKGWEWMEE